MTEPGSKPLGHEDESGFVFVKELLGEEPTAAVNFDRLQKHPTEGYLIFEYLLCDEAQTLTPYTSHPNRYWKKNAMKFLSLWLAAQDIGATLYLVNYAKRGTPAEDEVLLIKVLDMDENGITKEEKKRFRRAAFAQWFRQKNRECLSGRRQMLKSIYERKSESDLGRMVFHYGIHEGEAVAAVYETDRQYLEWLQTQDYSYAAAVACYLEKRAAERA